MGAILSSPSSSQIDAETFLSQLESCTEFESLKYLLGHSADRGLFDINFPANRLFRAVSTQLERFWLPERQNNPRISHKVKQIVLDTLCYLLDEFMFKSANDVVSQVDCETLEKLFRSLIPFWVANIDADPEDSDTWIPEFEYVGSLLWQFFEYDSVAKKYKQNQTKLITVLLGLTSKIDQIPEDELNFFSDIYYNGKDAYMDGLVYLLNHFEHDIVHLMSHIEFDQVLFACYRFMQHYEGDKLWSLHLNALSQVRKLVRFIANKLSSEIFDHFTLIEMDLGEKKLKLSSVVLVQYLKTLKLVPVEYSFEAIQLNSSEEVEKNTGKDDQDGIVEKESDKMGMKCHKENNEVEQKEKEDFVDKEKNHEDCNKEDDGCEKDQCDIQ